MQYNWDRGDIWQHITETVAAGQGRKYILLMLEQHEVELSRYQRQYMKRQAMLPWRHLGW